MGCVRDHAQERSMSCANDMFHAVQCFGYPTTRPGIDFPRSISASQVCVLWYLHVVFGLACRYPVHEDLDDPLRDSESVIEE